MKACPNCGRENADDSSFCANCGTALGTPTEERRFLTILFADLVGFTAESDQADPEDVRARLVPYHDRVRHEIERYGGTIEKLIGDGVMAVFGVPTAHEDDPERAVRAALLIQRAVERLNAEQPELGLSVRIGINSGEAVVTTGGTAERIVGDVVNTASRIESVATPGGVVVGETTHRATELLIDYERLEPVEVKGKADPLAIWRAIEPRGRYGIDAAVKTDTPFLGRESEMTILKETFRRVLDEDSIQLVTVAAPPGLGKTRLVNEFWQWVDDQPEIVWWRQGRCLPYGEGITFWALGEIVKGQAGIRESDRPQVASDKLATLLEAVDSDAGDRDWMAAQLSPLVGLASAESEATERAEAFTAWRHFLSDLAEINPLVMIIEDLHWADAALVEFLEDLLLWSIEVPIMVVCTARPELHEAHPGWGAGQRNAATISLAPLTDSQIARLISASLLQAAIPADTQAVLLERAGGNPLYAEEFVRMLNDKSALVGGSGEAAINVPETIQALIGARLDLLTEDDRTVLQTASVIGKVFWDGALAAVGGEKPDAIRQSLRSLVQREWVRPARSSSMEAQQEFAFWHILTRDVAYGRIPRSDRARKHRSTAGWIEEMTGERVSDHAELVAHHYQQALELTRAAGEAAELAELEQVTAQALIMAAERAAPLDATRSYGYYEEALRLLRSDQPDRARVLLDAGQMAIEIDEGTAIELLTNAAEAHHSQGDRIQQGRSLRWLARAQLVRDGGSAGKEAAFEAVRILESAPAGENLAEAYQGLAGTCMLGGQMDEAIIWSNKALQLIDELGLERLRYRSLSTRGAAVFDLGDVDAGLADLRQAVEIVEKDPLGPSFELAYVNLGDATWWVEGPEAGMRLYDQAVAMAERRGRPTAKTWAKAETMWPFFDLGRWDDLLDVADRLLDLGQQDEGQVQVWARSYRAYVQAWRGHLAEAAALETEFLPAAREIGDPQIFIPALGIASFIARRRGDPRTAVALATEIGPATSDHLPVYLGMMLVEAVRTLTSSGELATAEGLVDASTHPATRCVNSKTSARGLIAEAKGEPEEALALYERAGEDWADFGFKLEEGLARFGAGRCLNSLGRLAESADELANAREILTELGATPTIAEIDGLLEQAVAR